MKQSPPRAPYGAHPRSRGEHASSFFSKAAISGSSPLARGTREVGPEEPGREGLIPARAGNTSPVALLLCELRAHPRSRGEHPPVMVSVGSWVGSSPLARGTLNGFCRPLLTTGLIPARAGNTKSSLIFRESLRAHPRSRGEHLSKDWHRAIAAGSSPLARGTPAEHQ